MTEATRPEVIAVGKATVFPPPPVPDDVVVAAERAEMVCGGGTPRRPRDPVIEVALAGRHAAVGKDAGGVVAFDVAALDLGGPPTSNAVADHLTAVRIGHRPPPFGVVLAFGHLAGDVGDDRPEPGEFARVLAETGQRAEIDPQIDASPGGTCPGLLPVDEIEEYVGPQLID